MRKWHSYILPMLSDRLHCTLYHIRNFKRIPNFDNPKTLNEKISHIKLYRNNESLRRRISDRLKVREYVAKITKGIKFIPILWHGTDIRAKWNTLPQRFVIKANHGSGMLSFVDKEKMAIDELVYITNKWLSIDYSTFGREWNYSKLEHYLIAEKVLEHNGSIPDDYKFFCFNGKVKMVQVDYDRFVNHKRNLYNREFVRLNARMLYPPYNERVLKPKAYERAVYIADKLSKDFDFIRVDLYLAGKNVYFGELTNFPGNGSEPIIPESVDYSLGGELVLDDE